MIKESFVLFNKEETLFVMGVKDEPIKKITSMGHNIDTAIQFPTYEEASKFEVDYYTPNLPKFQVSSYQAALDFFTHRENVTKQAAIPFAEGIIKLLLQETPTNENDRLMYNAHLQACSNQLLELINEFANDYN